MPARPIRQDARRKHEAWLTAITDIPTAAGHEDRVVAWIERWVAARRNLSIRRDKAGNLLIARARRGTAATGRRRRVAPLFITAHLDHPAFVVVSVNGRDASLEFRGGVHDPYFVGARVEIVGRDGAVSGALVTALDSAAKPFKRVTARLDADAGPIQPGAIARWAFNDHGPLPRVTDGLLHTRACDDLAGVAAALGAMDVLHTRRGMDHLSLLFTRAEEVGFIGAIAACREGWIPKRARLICLETSRSFADSPIGGGPIVRVGDRMSVFEPALTNAISQLMTDHQKSRPEFLWQRRLMPGGTCEATAFSAYGYQSTCLCMALGNYHNMADIDAVAAGARPALVAPEFISVRDFHGLVEMLVLCATRLDADPRPRLRVQMDGLIKAYGHVLRGG